MIGMYLRYFILEHKSAHNNISSTNQGAHIKMEHTSTKEWTGFSYEYYAIMLQLLGNLLIEGEVNKLREGFIFKFLAD